MGWFKEENRRVSMKMEQISDLIGQGEVTWENKQKVQFFLARLLALLAGRSCFCLVVNLAAGLTVSLAIGGVELTSGKVVVGFLRWFLWNKLISFLRYYTAETGS